MMLSKVKGSGGMAEPVRMVLRVKETVMRLRTAGDNERIYANEPDWMSVEVEMD